MRLLRILSQGHVASWSHMLLPWAQWGIHTAISYGSFSLCSHGSHPHGLQMSPKEEEALRTHRNNEVPDLVHPTQRITVPPWGALGSLSSCPVQLKWGKADFSLSAHLITSPIGWVFRGWGKWFLSLEQGKEGRNRTTALFPINFRNGFSVFFEWLWLPFTGNDFF